MRRLSQSHARSVEGPVGKTYESVHQFFVYDITLTANNNIKLTINGQMIGTLGGWDELDAQLTQALK